MSLGDPNEVYKALQNLYVRAESLMMKPEGYKPLLTLLSDIRQKFENLTNLLEALDEQEALNLNFSKNSIVVENQQFEEHVQRWIKDTEDKLSKESRAFSYERSSVRTGSQSTSSSIRSEKQRSLVKLKIATAAVQQESARVYETRQKTRERAEEMKRKLMREAEEARQKAEREAEEARQKAEREAEEARQRAEREAEEARQRAEQEVEEARKRANEAMEEVNRQMKLEEEELERVLLDKKRNEELARIEAEAWEELSCGKAEEGTSTRKVPHLKIRDYSKPFSENVTTVKNAPLHNFPPRTSLLTDIPKSSVQINRPFPVTFAELPDQDLRIKVKNSSFSQKPESQFKSKFDYRNTEQAQRQEAFNSPSLTLPTSFHKYNASKMRPAPPVVIQKFNGDPMEYWLFVRQFEAHVLGKVEDYELFPLLHQYCESHVQSKFSYVLNQSPVTAFQKAWDILFDEYGHPYEIARCCEERLKNVHKIPDDKNKLKSLSQLLEKCCVSLKNIEQVSSLDSMHVIMGIVNKLPINLKQAWVEYTVQIEQQTGERAKFLDLSKFVTEKSRIANSIFGRETFQTNYKPCRESAYVSATTKNVKDALSVEKSRCFYCEKVHKLIDCNKFKNLTYKEKYKFVKAKGLCFKCLSGNHFARYCKSSCKCLITGCKGTFHHTLLHKITDTEVTGHVDACSSIQFNKSTGNVQHVFLNVVPVRVRCEGKETEVYAFLDQGSTACFCDRSLAMELQLSSTSRQLKLQTLTETKSYRTVSAEMEVKGLFDGDWVQLPDVTVVDEIPVQPNVIPTSQILSDHSYLADINFSKLDRQNVQLLIGANVPRVFRLEDLRSAPDKLSPDAVKSPLGWSLLAPCSKFNCTVSSSDKNVYYVSTLRDNFEEDDRNFIYESRRNFSNIQFQCYDKDNYYSKPISMNDFKVYRMLKSSIKLVDDHYELPLPWKYEDQIMPNNKNLALKQLNHLKRKLMRNSDLKQKYSIQIQTMLDKNYAELVHDNFQITSKKVWYIPHHSVITPHKPDKLRVVFDCSAEYKGISLNKSLMQGPHLMNDLVAILSRFRKEKIALAADIESMYYQVQVSPRDHDSLRFLWWPDGNLESQPVVHRMKVHLFGATSSPCCASFALRQAAIDFGAQFEPYISSAIEEHFYVDDFLISVPNVEIGLKLRKDIKHLLSKASFNLTKWCSNCPEIIKHLPENELSKSLQINALAKNSSERVLGVNWNLNTDCFYFVVELPDKPCTKRGVLSLINSIFDPLGFLCPVIVEAKLLY